MTMYREKLLDQIRILEEKQSQCGSYDTDNLVELGRNILSLAKRIDEYDARNKSGSCGACGKCRGGKGKCRRKSSPKKVIRVAVKQALKEYSDKIN